MEKELNNNVLLKIEWPKPNQTRIRKVVRRSNYRVTGKYPSIKMGRPMQWESTLERDAFYLLDADPTVQKFYEQPARFTYVLDGQVHHHYPDIYIETANGCFFREVKSDKEVAEANIITRTQYLQLILRDQGLGYSILTESEIHLEPRLSNVKRVLRYGRGSISLSQQERLIQRYFQHGKGCNLGDITHNSYCLTDFPIFCRMILAGTVATDFNQPWDDEQRFFLQTSMEATKCL